jgi:hypothetical protein
MKRSTITPKKRKTSGRSKPIIDEHDHAGATQSVQQSVPRRAPAGEKPSPRPARG